MTQAQRIFLIFVGFIGLFACVKVIDHYSRDYLECSRAWRTEIEQSKTNPLWVDDLKSRLERDNKVTVNNEACPGLWPDHKARLMAELNAIE